ncbi:MAG: DUF4384 domain-containing protein [Thermodesulfobacteriota bacterium]
MKKHYHTRKQQARRMAGTVLPAALALMALILLAPGSGSAQNSIITTGEGMAALGNDKTRNQAMTEARDLARRNAAEKAATHIQSVSTVENFALAKDVVKAYAEAVVTILEELESGWTSDPRMGESFRIVIKAEVVPNFKAGKDEDPQAAWFENPAAPLTVKLTTPRQAYRAEEQVTIYLQGNKPFFARVVYEDSSGNLTQILPNPYRTENYFQGSSIYSLPSGNDQYTMTVVPPFGEERVTVYAATQPLGEVDKQARGPVYLLNEKRGDVAVRTRGIKLSAVLEEKAETKDTAEFYETSLTIRTGP